MFARNPGLFKNVQTVTRSTWSSSPTDDAISTVDPNRAFVMLTGQFSRWTASVPGSAFFSAALSGASYLRWSWSGSAPQYSGWVVAAMIYELWDLPKRIDLISQSCSGAGASAKTTDVAISVPAGGATNRCLIAPMSLMPDYSGNGTYYTPVITSSTNLRINWYAATADTWSRTVNLALVWF